MTGRSPLITLNNGADIERIRPEEIKRAFERVMNTDVRYRFVIDTALLKA